MALQDRGGAPTAGNTSLATTAYVDSADALKAPLASPALTGTPTAPTATAGTNTTQIATTAFVTAGLALKANLASPTFTGVPLSTTPAANDNTTKIATTAYVQGEISSLAPLASPALTGVPTAPTAAAGTNTTQIATTAFVAAGLALKANLAGATFTSTILLNGSSSYPRWQFDSGGATWLQNATLFTQLYSDSTTAVGVRVSNGVSTTMSLTANSAGTTNLTAQGIITITSNTQATTAADFNVDNDGSPRVWSNAILNRNYTVISAVPGSATSSVNGVGVVTSSGTLGQLNGALQQPDAYTRVITTRALFVASNGYLGTSASSRRVKDLLGEQHWDDAMLKRWLAIPVHRFKYKDEVVDPTEAHLRHLGMIAEDVHEAGFTEFVHYEERKDSEHHGRVEGLAYDRMSVLDHLAMRRMLERIEALETRLKKEPTAA